MQSYRGGSNHDCDENFSPTFNSNFENDRKWRKKSISLENNSQNKNLRLDSVSSSFIQNLPNHFTGLSLANVYKKAVNNSKGMMDQLRAVSVAEFKDDKSLFYFVLTKNLFGLQQKIQSIKVERGLETAVSFRTKFHGRNGSDCRSKHSIFSDISANSSPIEISVDRVEVDRRNAVGANIIHSSYLYENFAMGRWLVENYPVEALGRYTSKWEADQEMVDWFSPDKVKSIIKGYDSTEEMPYAGENILHIAIIKKNIVEIRWILEFYVNLHDVIPDGLEHLLSANAVGYFFERGGETYFGSYPLHFAAASNSVEIFDMVLSYSSLVSVRHVNNQRNDAYATRKDKSASKTKFTSLGSNAIFMRDRYGNNCLHICVIHRLSEMYKHVIVMASALIKREIRNEFIKKESENKVEDVKRISIEPLRPWKDGDNESSASNFSEFWLKAAVFLGRYYPSSLLPKKFFNQRAQYSSAIHNGFHYGYSMTEALIEIPKPLLKKTQLLEQEYLLGEWLNEATATKLRERLIWVLNEEFHSPLTLASKFGQSTAEEEEAEKVIINNIIEQSKTVRWKYGFVVSSVLELEGIAIPYDYRRYDGKGSSKPLPWHARDYMHGVVEWICITESSPSITIPEITKLINSKWAFFGYPMFMLYFVFRLTATILITWLLIYSSQSPPDTQYEVTTIYAIVFSILVFLFIIEIPSMLYYGLEYWGINGNRIRGIAKVEKGVSTAIFVFYSAWFITELLATGNLITSQGYTSLHTSRNSTKLGSTYDPSKLSPSAVTARAYASLTGLLTWLHLFYFLLGFESTGPMVMIISRIVKEDMPYFLLFFAILLMGFTCSLLVITDPAEASDYDDWAYFIYGIVYLIQISLNVANNTNVYINSRMGSINVDENLQTIFLLLSIAFYVFAVLMFLNILIAMINNTYSILGTEDKYRPLLLVGKYDMMCGIELSVSFWMRLLCMPNISSRFAIQSKPGSQQGIAEYNFEVFEKNFKWQENVSEISEESKKSVALLLISPQNDFLDDDDDDDDDDKALTTTTFYQKPKFPQPGAQAAASRVAEWIESNIDVIDNIVVTLTSNPSEYLGIWNVWSWTDSNGKHPPHNTKISSDDITERKWNPVDKSLECWVKEYVAKVESKGNHNFTVRNPYCVVGTYGHAVIEIINQQLQKWATRHQKSVQYVNVGNFLRVEQYSIFSAEIEDSGDPTTFLNTSLLAKLHTMGKVFMCGFSLGLSVRCSMTQLLQFWTGQKNRLHLLVNCCSAFRDSHSMREVSIFLDSIRNQGVVVSTGNYCDSKVEINACCLSKPIGCNLTRIDETVNRLNGLISSIEYKQFGRVKKNQQPLPQLLENAYHNPDPDIIVYRVECDNGRLVPTRQWPSSKADVVGNIRHNDVIQVRKKICKGFLELVDNKGFVSISKLTLVPCDVEALKAPNTTSSR